MSTAGGPGADSAALATLRQRLADQAMTLDVLSTLETLGSPEAVVEALLDLATDLTGAQLVAYLPADGTEGRAHRLGTPVAAETALPAAAADCDVAVGRTGRLCAWHVADSGRIPDYRQLLAAAGAAGELVLRQLRGEASGEIDRRLMAAFRAFPLPLAMMQVLPDGGVKLMRVNDAFAATIGSVHTVPAEVLTAALQQPVTHEFIDPDGSHRWAELATNTITSRDGTDTRLLHVSDITEARRTEELRLHAARHDPVTDLPNREYLLQLLRATLTTDRARNMRTMVTMIDLDDFRTVNTSLGRDAGDEYLRGVADALRGEIRTPDDLVGHLGGDHFVMIFSGVQDDSVAAALAESVRRRLADGIDIGGRTISAAASLGVAVSRRRSTAPKLLGQAEIAMYQAKSEHGNNWRLHRAEFDSADVLTLEDDLRRAIASDDFDVRYQPVFRLDTGQLVEVEALLRWQHPTRGPIPPPTFIDVAERRNLMGALGDWVLARACAQAARWRAQLGEAAPQVAVNVSIRQLGTGEFAEAVGANLERFSLPPQSLQLEITETQILRAGSPAAQEIRTLAQQGIRIAVDDFGTGYAGFNYLRGLPVHVLKIDKSFVSDAPSDPTDRAILTGIVALGRSLGLDLVAEGVEELDQLELLQELGCTMAQGWLWRPALPPGAVGELVGHHESELRQPSQETDLVG